LEEGFFKIHEDNEKINEIIIPSDVRSILEIGCGNGDLLILLMMFIHINLISNWFRCKQRSIKICKTQKIHANVINLYFKKFF